MLLAQAAFAAVEVRGWDSLTALSPGKTINVYTGTAHKKCTFVSADDAQLTCTHGKKDTYTFARTEIQKVRLAYRPTYTIIGFVAGAGIGAVIGYAVEHTSSNSNCIAQPGTISFCGLSFDGIAEAAGALAGGVIGAVAGTGGGLALDLGLRKTVYQGP
jgi:hypothetical protein